MPDIDSLISQMTLHEKAALCTGASAWSTTAIERLGIPGLVVSDGPHGVRKASTDGMLAESLPATCFPTASCLSSTWNPDLIREMGEALAEECIALGVNVLLGPGNNMKRLPACGRNFEYFSEDPFLSGEMASAFIKGVQSRGVGTSLKHYAANNQEFNRLTVNALIDERTLREIYLPAFEKAVKTAKPWTVMCAYNRINGDFCSENDILLTDILKKEWEFEGFVVSDWGAVHDRVRSLNAGLDLEMPGPREKSIKAVIDAVESGELDIKILDESVKRILYVVFKAREISKGTEYNKDKHHALSHKNHLLARKIAGEGIVLLKNNGILPLKDCKKIAVIGHSAKNPHFQGGGSSHINPAFTDIPFEELKKLSDAEFTFTEGYLPEPGFDLSLIDQAAENAENADAVILFIALPSFKESEGYDREDLDLTKQQVALIEEVTTIQPNTIVVFNNGSAITMSEWLHDAAAVLEAWMPGQAGGGAIADVIFGKINPSGKLSETFPFKLEDTPGYINYPGENGEVRYGEGIFTGYRYYDTKKVHTQFPFGFGLSYSFFEYNDAKVSATMFTDMDGITVSVDVTNTGEMEAKEIVQVYVHDRESRLMRPEKELKAFTKLVLAPGETKTAFLNLDFRSFAFYHPAYKMWITEDGEFDILIGASSEDIKFTITVTLKSTVELPCLLNRESTLRDWLDDIRGSDLVDPLVKKIKAGFTGSEEGEEGHGMDMTGFLLDMPLISLLQFREAEFEKSADELVDELLEKVGNKK